METLVVAVTADTLHLPLYSLVPRLPSHVWKMFCTWEGSLGTRLPHMSVETLEYNLEYNLEYIL